MGAAAHRWADALGTWAIPQAILDAAPESPWSYPPELFSWRPGQPDAAGERPSRRRALEALPMGGSVLDVGAGGGAAGLPLAPPAARVVGVDESPAMLRSFRDAAGAAGVAHRTVEGRWPDVAAGVERADVVVCHHVLYNVADLGPFALALTDHARRRVVVEITASHPQSAMNPLWRALHGIERPTSPTAGEALAVLEELGLDVGREDVETPPRWGRADAEARVAFARRRLCVGPERDPEIADLLERHGSQPQRVVTLWWPGVAGE